MLLLLLSHKLLLMKVISISKICIHCFSNITSISYLGPISIFVPSKHRLCWPCIRSTVVTRYQPVVCTKRQEEAQSPCYPKNPPSQGCSSHPHNASLNLALMYEFPWLSALRSLTPHCCPLCSLLPSPYPKERGQALSATPWHAGSCEAKRLQ